MTTKIEWCQETWNPITGCSKISEGCRNCYAERMAKRLAGRYGYPADDPFRVTFHPDRIEQPLKWKKPRRIFVCSMGDLFHGDVCQAWLADIFDVIERCPQHKFLLLTKRPYIMAKRLLDPIAQMLPLHFHSKTNEPLKNVWLGTTVENNDYLWRITHLLSIPAAVRFVSIEPMLGPVRIDYSKMFPTDACFQKPPMLDWVIVGGESGPGARQMRPDWVRSVRDDCVNAGIPFFFKQWGSNPDKSAFDEPYGMVCARNELPKYGRMIDGRTWDGYPDPTEGE